MRRIRCSVLLLLGCLALFFTLPGCGGPGRYRTLSYGTLPQDHRPKDWARGYLYHLPHSVLTFDFTVVRSEFVPGPYAAYAEQYMGVPASAQGRVAYVLSGVDVRGAVEPDPAARFMVVGPEGRDYAALCDSPLLSDLYFAGCGAAGSGQRAYVQESVDEGQAGREELFRVRSTEPLIREARSTYYSVGQRDSAFVRVPLERQVIVSMQPAEAARKVSERLFELRTRRLGLLSGDTDHAHDGGAMGIMVSGLERSISELESLFFGVTLRDTLRYSVEVIPNVTDEVMMVARFSSREGLRPVTDRSVRPLLLTISPAETPAGQPWDGKSNIPSGFLVLRQPLECSGRLSHDGQVILQFRLPIYQYGPWRLVPWAGALLPGHQ